MTIKNVFGRAAVGITLTVLSGLLVFSRPALATVAGISRPASTRQFQAAPAVTTDNASTVTSSAAMLNGTITDLGDSSSVVRFFDWGLSTDYGQEILLPGTANATGTFSVPLYGLTANTTYHFRARVLGLGGGGYVNGEDETFTTSPLPPALPFLLKWGKLGPGDGDFNRPDGIAVDSDGDVYVSDGNGRVQKFDALGNFVLKWGSIGEGNGQFYGAVSLAVDASANVYAADNNMSRVQKFSDDGTFLGIVAPYGSLDGQVNRPEGVAADSQGNLYIADTQNNRIQKLSSDGTFLAKWGTYGNGPGQFRYPTDVAVDREGNVYVADRDNYRIQKFTGSGNFTLSWDANCPDQTYTNAPRGLTFDLGSNTLYVANFDNDRINAFDPAGGVAGKFGSTGSAAGQFSDPIDVAVGTQGAVYVVDQANNRVQVFGHTPLAPASVSTDPASAITQNTAVLNGTLNNLPEGASANVSFEWGSSPSTLTEGTLPVSLSAGGSYGAGLTGLTPVTPYYFRAKLTVGTVTSYGAVCTLFTPPPLLFKLGGFPGGDVQLITPQGVATDSAGNIFVSDSSLSKVKKFSRTGSFITEWTPQDPGPGIANSPQGLAVDSEGNVYAIDAYAIQKFTNSGEFVTKWGSYGSADGQFNGLVALAVDSHDVVYAIGWGDDRVQKFTSSGAFTGKWRTGFIPSGIAVDASDNVYIGDVYYDRIHKYSDNGTLITWWGSAGTGDGQFQFPQPTGITVDRSGTVYVADGKTFNSGRIQMFTDNGTFIGTWGSPGSGDYQFRSPKALAIDASGRLSVIDDGNYRVQVFAMTAMPVVTTRPVSGVTTTSAVLNGRVISLDSAPSVNVSFEWGAAADSLIHETPAVSVNHAGDFSDTITGLAANTIYYFRAKIVAGELTGYGEVLRFATPPPFLMKWGSQGSTDGRFSNPHGIALDGLGNVYVADSYNNRIEKFTASGQFIAKWGTAGTGDGQFQDPLGLAVDSLGNVFVADSGNARIQKFAASGQFLTSWGTRGTADGQFDGPAAIAVDQSGSVYVTEFGNHRVQKFTNSGGFLAKWGSLGGPDIRFDSPFGIAVDPSGFVYVVDSYTEWVQKFSASGELVGKWGSGGSGDGQFQSASDIAIDAAGNVYVVDAGNHRIQRFTGSGEYLAQWGSSGTGDGQFFDAYGIAVSPTGNVYVVEGNSNNRVQAFGFTAPAPVVTTSFASSVTPHAAVLNGVLSSLAGSVSADVSFEWGTSADNLSHQTTPVSTSHTGSFAASIGGLTESTTYYFRAKAVRSGVASFGDVLSFPTPGPLAVITGDAIQVTAGGVQLVGNLVSLGGTASANVSFEWGQLPGSLTEETPAVPMAATGTYRADLTGLATTTYYFRSKAVSGDTAVLGTVHSFTTPPPFLFVFGGFGSGDGLLIDPQGIAIDPDGNVYVVDELNFCVQKFTANGTFVTRWGTQGAGNGQFNVDRQR